MDLKGAEIRNIYELCMEMGTRTKAPFRVNIPYYQRPYKWAELQITNLINDFYKSDEKEYFVGSVVMVENANGLHDIIDGQQRTTTLFLLNYLKFLLLRAYIEELLLVKKTTKVDSLLTNLEDTILDLLGENKANEIKGLHGKIIDVLDTIGEIEEDEEKENLYEEVLLKYQQGLGLPEKNLSSKENYKMEYCLTTKTFLSNCAVSMKYDRTAYNTKLLTALSEIVVILSDTANPFIETVTEIEDKIVAQYANAIKYEFEAIQRNVSAHDKKPLDYTKMIIDAINSMLEKIKLCVIITGCEKDAYTLFEVLNDRSLEVEDLDLIKNKLFKEYCKKTTDNDFVIDQNIENADKIWVEDVFTTETGKERAKLISFLAAQYFTGDESLKFNENERYREILESKYLDRCNVYDGDRLLNDIKIYQMISIILSEMDFRFNKRNEKAISAECDLQKSVTYRTLHLLHALKMYGVIPAITNVILSKYLEKTLTPTNNIINIGEFTNYIKGLRDDSQHNTPIYKDIHEVSFEFWKYALLSKNAEIPRKIAKTYISEANAFGTQIAHPNVDSELVALNKEFVDWMHSWKYGTGDTSLKAKVLFINLYGTSKVGNVLKYLPTRHVFATTDIQLDHMEANKKNDAASEKYFEPKGAGVMREHVVNGIGNFMILDREDNNDKNNLPMQEALKFYDAMDPNHWMISEVREMLNDDKYSTQIKVLNVEYSVPNEDFFSERKSRLTAYFSAILNRKIDQNQMYIIKED